MFSELDELSSGREGGASIQAPDDVPSFPFLYGLSSLLGRHSKFIGRFRIVNLTGLSAVAAGIS